MTAALMAMLVPAKAQTSDALVGEWCLVETKINSTCPRADVLTILPAKVIVWSVAPGDPPRELTIKSLRKTSRPNIWKVDYVGGEFTETWSLSKNLLITQDGRGHSHTYVRRTREGD